MDVPTNISDSISQSGVPAFFRLIDSQLRGVKELINEQLTAPAEAGDINQLLEHVRGRSGKMIRPGLVLLAGGCCGKITDEHIRVAAIVEMIHNATLLHDDVIDEGQQRRGRPTVNNLLGNETAVLLGDFLLSRVFKMCAGLAPQVAKVIAGAAVRVCEGELRQIAQKRNWQLSESEYIDIITEKSAVLFSSACHLGALLAQGTEAQTRSLAEFGLNAGIAFQITDDLLDIIGDESKTGKTVGSDVGKYKLTLAVIHLLRAVDKRGKETVINSYFERENVQYDKDALAKMLGRYGSLEYAHDRAQEFVTRSIGALENFKESDAKNALIETAKFMACRTT
jgi:octaprenyl-diphosphate synthase